MLDGVPVSWYLILSAVLFALGVAGFLFRRNIITVFMSIELMLNAVNLSFVTFSYQLKQVDGQIFTFFVMVVAAAEAAVGLAIILTVFKNRQTLEHRRSQFAEELDAESLAHPFLPLAGFLINGIFGRRFSKSLVNVVRHRQRGAGVRLGAEGHPRPWRSRTRPTPSTTSPGSRAAPSRSAVDFAVDRLTAVMLLIVTGIGSLIHIYSIGYMAHEGTATTASSPT